jgi:hypothetical protein
VYGLVGGDRGIAGGELIREAPAEASWAFRPRATSGEIGGWNGSVRLIGSSKRSNGGGGSSGGVGITEKVTAAEAAGVGEDGPSRLFCCLRRCFGEVERW